MELQTLGHASLLLRDEGGRPLLLTDPWLIGSCYWRSWWLQHYPSDEQFRELRMVRYCYITHEHPDHFHTASIRKLGFGPEYLSPWLPERAIAPWLEEQGFRARTLGPLQWYPLTEHVRILSIPQPNDDSILIINTPRAFIIDLNDAKPSARRLRRLARFMDRYAQGKKRLLLSSYSPASLVNSFLRDGQRVSLRSRQDYVAYICRNCRILSIDYFLPFASQAIFERSDSAWANEYKVGYDDLLLHWSAERTMLLPPYTRLSLVDFSHRSLVPSEYRRDPVRIQRKVEAEERRDRETAFYRDDAEELRRRLNRHRLAALLFFNRGIGFEIDDVTLTYYPRRGAVTMGEATGDIVLRLPTGALKDVLDYGHFGDLGTTMFTLIVLNRSRNPRLVYLFFMLITLYDYRHTVSLRNFVRWIASAVRLRGMRLPAPPRFQDGTSQRERAKSVVKMGTGNVERC